LARDRSLSNVGCVKISARRWLGALGALLAGGAVSVSLLLAADPDRQSMEVYAAAADIPAGAPLSANLLRVARVKVDGSVRLFTLAEEGTLMAMHAAHDLQAGQLLQRGDVASADSSEDRRLVFVAVKGSPPAGPGSHVDLLAIRIGADRTSVLPFALGVEVEGSVAGGLIVVVPSRQAAAFAYASATMELVAVIAPPGVSGGEEVPVSSPDEALVVASR
jgi:hypothetical protein